MVQGHEGQETLGGMADGVKLGRSHLSYEKCTTSTMQEVIRGVEPKSSHSVRSPSVSQDNPFVWQFQHVRRESSVVRSR